MAAFFIAFCAGIVSAQNGNAEPKRIEILDGNSSASERKNLKNGEQAEYVFYASAGQTLRVSVTASPRGRHFDLRIAGSSFELETDDQDHSVIEFTVPESGDYLIYVIKRIHSRNTNATFNMTLKLN